MMGKAWKKATMSLDYEKDKHVEAPKAIYEII